MATLHTVNKSPFQDVALKSCLGHARDGDTVLLIEDGVYGGLDGTTLADLVAAATKTLRILALSEDLAARGLDAARLLKGIGTVGYDGFVDLVAETDRTQAWL